MTSVQMAAISSIVCCRNAGENPGQISWARGLGATVVGFRITIDPSIGPNARFKEREVTYFDITGIYFRPFDCRSVAPPTQRTKSPGYLPPEARPFTSGRSRGPGRACHCMGSSGPGHWPFSPRLRGAARQRGTPGLHGCCRGRRPGSHRTVVLAVLVDYTVGDSTQDDFLVLQPRRSLERETRRKEA